MHVDAVAARRLLSGHQVAHGVHTLLWALELWLADRPHTPWQFDCRFAQPINVGDLVVFDLHGDRDGAESWLLTACVNGLVCTELNVHTGASARAGQRPPSAASAAAATALPHSATALDLPAAQWPGQVLTLADVPGPVAQLFPNCVRALGEQRTAAIAQLSYFVGMVCPGLHSIFSSTRFELGAERPGQAALTWTIDKFDPRFRLFSCRFSGVLEGELKAFLRPEPQRQPGAAAVAALVHPGEFAGQQALVIGGSRGLGETTAKLLAGGGARVVVSFATGLQDAQAVADDINANGRGRCDLVQLDLRRQNHDMLARALPPQQWQALNAVYYFATPRIYAKRSALFEPAMFSEFVEFYLQGLFALCQVLEQQQRTQPVKVYLPSTVFITDRPKGMTEYAMAKAAAEVLADDLNRSLKQVRIVHTRLPRLATDQTTAILQLRVESNLETLLPVVRSMNP